MIRAMAFVSVAACAALAVDDAAAAGPDEGLAVPGACFVMKTAPRAKDKAIDRIELQQVQTQTKDGKQLEAPRVRIGVLPAGSDDLIPSDVSAPCSRKGNELTCTFKCDESSSVPELGRVRVTTLNATSIKVTFDTPLTLNACTPGEPPVAMPKSLTGRSFVVRKARSTSECFH